MFDSVSLRASRSDMTDQIKEYSIKKKVGVLLKIEVSAIILNVQQKTG